jgi:hypothetical protein
MNERMTDTPTAPAVSPSPPASPTAPSAAQWHDLSPQQRFEHQQTEVDRQNGTTRPGLKPGEKVDAATYDRMTYAERVEYAQRAQQQASAANPNPNSDPAAPPAPADPASRTVQVGDLSLTEAEILAAVQSKAERDVLIASVPETPEKYELKLPADFKAPPGVEFKFDLADPIKGDSLRRAQAWSKENSLTQQQFSELLGLYAGALSHEATVIENARAAEVAKLGAAGAARVDAVSTWLRAELGDKLARPMLLTLATAAHVEGFEKLLQRRQAQGSANFSQRHRDHHTDKIDQATYDRMSYSEKKAYAERHSSTGR